MWTILKKSTWQLFETCISLCTRLRCLPPENNGLSFAHLGASHWMLSPGSRQREGILGNATTSFSSAEWEDIRKGVSDFSWPPQFSTLVLWPLKTVMPTRLDDTELNRYFACLLDTTAHFPVKPHTHKNCTVNLVHAMSVMTEAELFVYFFMTVKWIGESHPCVLHITY